MNCESCGKPYVAWVEDHGAGSWTAWLSCDPCNRHAAYDGEYPDKE